MENRSENRTEYGTENSNSTEMRQEVKQTENLQNRNTMTGQQISAGKYEQSQQQTEAAVESFEQVEGSEKKESETLSLWELIQKECEHCQPFADDLLTDCVRVTRQQVNMLRKSGWNLDANQFVNRGMDNFQHFLLCRHANRPGFFYIGIPGVFNANEQFMAGLFGYHNFRSARPAPQGTNMPNYGYWIRRIGFATK